MKGLDLRGFRKIESSKDSTTLAHPEGHEIKIAHKALDPKMLKAVKALPHMDDGGQAKNNSVGANEQDVRDFSKGAQEPVNPSLKEVWQNLKDSVQPVRKPSIPEKMADGGDIDFDKNASSPEDDNAPLQTPMPEIQGVASHNPLNDADPERMSQASQSTPLPNGGAEGPALAAEIAKNPGPAATVGENLANTAASNPPPSAPMGQPGAQAPDPYGVAATQGALYGGIREQQAGFQQEANAAAQQGKAEVAAQQAAQNKLTNLQSQYSDHLAGLNTERDNLLSDIKEGHIDPKRYLNNMSTGSKIATALGFLFSGFGGADAVHLASDNFQRLVSQDIDAQKAELGKKENLLSNNLAQFHNLNDATNMSRVQVNDMLNSQLSQAKSGALGPMAQARAHQLSGQLQTQNAQLIGQMAMRKTLLSGMANGQVRPEAAVTMLVPQEQRAAAIKELQDAQNHKTLLNDTMAAFDELAKLNTVGNRITSPIQSAKAINAIKGPALDKLTKDTSGRVTPETVKLIGGMFDTLGSSGKTMQQQRAALSKLLNQNASFPILQTYGINPFSNPGSTAPIPKSAPVKGR